MLARLYLAFAIATEVVGTVELRVVTAATNKWPPLALVTVAYIASYAFMALALRHIGIGAVYAIWAGAGTAAIAVLGWLLFGEKISWTGAMGVALIVGGVIVLVVSGSAAHGSATT